MNSTTRLSVIIEAAFTYLVEGEQNIADARGEFDPKPFRK